MIVKKILSLMFLAFSFTTFCNAQDNLLSKLPETKEEFKASENNFIASVNWLENTSIAKNETARQKQNMLVTAWLINSPTVTISINADMIDFDKKNSDLLILFMGGWGKYALENNYSQDIVEGTLAGLRTCIRVYEKGEMKKDKFMLKVIALEKSNELEKWVRQKINEGEGE